MFTIRQISRSVIANQPRSSLIGRSLIPRLTRARAFHNSVIFNDKQTDELREIIGAELKFEENDPVSLEKFHQEYLDNSGFVIAKAGTKSIICELIKETEKEKIHVFFNPLEVTNIPLESEILKRPPPGEEEGSAAAAEHEDQESFSSLEEGDHGEHGEGSANNLQQLFDETIANVTVIVANKTNNQGLYFNLLLSIQTNYFAIGGLKKFDNISKQIQNTSAQDEFERDLQYYGPPFTNLDEYLQEGLMEYLNSRGIDKSLGDFISGFSLARENELYLNWLKELKDFF